MTKSGLTASAIAPLVSAPLFATEKTATLLDWPIWIPAKVGRLRTEETSFAWESLSPPLDRPVPEIPALAAIEPVPKVVPP